MSQLLPGQLKNTPLWERRLLISSVLKTAGAAAFLMMPGINFALPYKPKTYTVQDIMNMLIKDAAGAPFSNTVDTLKSGDPNQQVTGIVTTMFATAPLIESAAKLGANFIIAHEPTFYNHTDNTSWVANNEVVARKQALLKKHGIAVWRFHDYWHAYKPDGIMYGVVKKAGWESYFKKDEAVLIIPALSLKELVLHLKNKLSIQHVRVVGNLTQECKKIAVLPGAWGGQRQVSVAENQKPDVLIVGETPEWETVEYIRDAQAFGKSISLIILGHAVSEEPGMEYLVDLLQPKIEGIKVTHIATPDPFQWL